MTSGLAREIICFRMLNKISRGAVHRLERVHDGSHILRLPVCHVSCGQTNLRGGPHVLPWSAHPRFLAESPRVLCVLGMGNSCVRPNDRLPVNAKTHEKSCARKSCLKDKITKKAAISTQVAQAITSGYFGGYMSKNQPSGQLELKKCVPKMLDLKERNFGKTQKAQERAVAARMVTDLECNGVCRGAVEVTNLAANLNKTDALAQECVRTFPTQHLDGRIWLHRLDAAVGMRDAIDLRYHIKVFPRHTRQGVTAHESAPYDELYAARSKAFCWWRLSSFEFVRHWIARPVLPPPEARNPKTCWREGMSDWFHAELQAGRTPVAKAGTHCDLDPDELEHCHRIDESVKTSRPTLFDNWVLCRREVPCVPVIENCRVPRCDGDADENGKYFLMFFHPWTSIPALASEFVPLLGQLGHAAEVRRRYTKKGAAST